MANQLTMSVVLQLVDQMSGRVQEAVNKSKGHLDSFAERAKEVGREMTNFGAASAAAGAVISGGVGAAVKQFADLEQGMAQLKATMTGKDGLSANFQAVSDLSIKLGNQLPGNTADFAGMLNKLLQLGVTEKDLLGGVGEAAAKLAAVIKIPYDEAAEIAAKLKEATGTANEDMLKFMDTIQRTAHQGVRASEMMYAFSHSAGGMKQFKIQGEEATRSLSALFAILLKSGLSGETAGTNMVTFLNTLAKYDFSLYGGKKQGAVDELTESLRQMGITLDFFDDQTKEFKGIDNVFAQLGKLKELDQGKFTEILQTLFGGGMDQQIAALIAQGGTDKLANMMKSMEDQADLSERSVIQLTTLSAKWEAAFGTFQNTLAAIGERLAPTLGALVDTFGAVSEKVGKWISENKELATVITTVVGALGAGLAAIGAVGLAAGGAVMTFGVIATGISAIATAATAALPVLAALAANPVVLAIFGVGAAAAVGWKFGNFLKDQIDIAVNAMTGSGSLGVAIFDMVEAIKKLPQKFKDAGAAIIQGLIDGMKAKALEAIKSVEKLGTDMLDGMKSILKIRSPSQAMQEIGEQTAQGYVLGIQSGIKSVGEVAAQLAGAATSGAGSPFAANDPSFQASLYAEREVAETAHQERMFSIRGFFESQNAQQAVRYQRLNLSSAATFFSQMGALMQTKSRALFEIGKAGAIGETIISTYVSAQKAYAAMAGIPIVGPALGAAAAAAAVLAGMARVSAISSTSFGSASGSPVLSGGGFSGPVVSGDSGVVPFNANSPARPVAPERTVNVYLKGSDIYSGSAIRDSLIPALNEALGDGVKLNVGAA